MLGDRTLRFKYLNGPTCPQGNDHGLFRLINLTLALVYYLGLAFICYLGFAFVLSRGGTSSIGSRRTQMHRNLGGLACRSTRYPDKIGLIHEFH